MKLFNEDKLTPRLVTIKELEDYLRSLRNASRYVGLSDIYMKLVHKVTGIPIAGERIPEANFLDYCDATRDVADAVAKFGYRDAVAARLRKLKSPIKIEEGDDSLRRQVVDLFMKDVRSHSPGKPEASLLLLLNPRKFKPSDEIVGNYAIGITKTGRFVFDPCDLKGNLSKFKQATAMWDRYWDKFVLMYGAATILLDGYLPKWPEKDRGYMAVFHTSRNVIADWLKGGGWFPEYAEEYPMIKAKQAIEEMMK